MPERLAASLIRFWPIIAMVGTTIATSVATAATVTARLDSVEFEMRSRLASVERRMDADDTRERLHRLELQINRAEHTRTDPFTGSEGRVLEIRIERLERDVERLATRLGARR